MPLEIRPVELNDEHDREGRLVFQDGRLAAILSRLSDQHAARSGRWFLEYGAGPLASCNQEFDTLEAAANWVEHNLKEAEH